MPSQKRPLQCGNDFLRAKKATRDASVCNFIADNRDVCRFDLLTEYACKVALEDLLRLLERKTL
jgi:hypothetical protein